MAFVSERSSQHPPLPGLELERLAFPAILGLDQVLSGEVGESRYLRHKHARDRAAALSIAPHAP